MLELTKHVHTWDLIQSSPRPHVVAGVITPFYRWGKPSLGLAPSHAGNEWQMQDSGLETAAPTPSPELPRGTPVAEAACSKRLPISGGVTLIPHSLTPELPWRAMRLLLTVVGVGRGGGAPQVGEGWGQQAFLEHLGLSFAGRWDALACLLPEAPEAQSIGKGSGCSDRAGDTRGLLEGLVSCPDSQLPRQAPWPRGSAGGLWRWPLTQVECGGGGVVPGARAHPYHGVLVVDFDDNDGGVVPQLMSFAIELQVVEHQHLVPGGAQGLIQHLQHVWGGHR